MVGIGIDYLHHLNPLRTNDLTLGGGDGGDVFGKTSLGRFRGDKGGEGENA